MDAPRVELFESVASLAPSATLAINERSNALAATGRQIFKFGLGQSPFPVPPHVVDALRAEAHQKDYLAVQGDAPLREAVASHHRRFEGGDRSADDVVVGPGSKELMFLLQLVFAGETVLPAPSWVSYVPQATILKRAVCHLPTTFEGRWRLEAQTLDEHCQRCAKPHLLILNYPGNPDGLTYSAKELGELAEVARRHRIVVLSDEIYGLLNHEGAHVSISRFYPEGTIVSGGLSKWCGAGGWRLGTFIFPPQLSQLRNALTAVASETFTSVSAPIQKAAVTAFADDGRLDDYLVHSRRVLSVLGQHCAQSLSEVGAGVHTPQGAFYLFVDLEHLRPEFAKAGIDGSAAFAERLLDKTGVALLPGDVFGLSQRLSFRMAYVNFDGAEALKQSRLVGGGPLKDDDLRSTCGGVYEAMARLSDFVSHRGGAI